MIASFATMALLYVLISKFVPLISIWELKTGEHPRIEGRGLSSGGGSCGRADYERDIRALQNADAAQRAFDGLRVRRCAGPRNLGNVIGAFRGVGVRQSGSSRR